MTLRSSYEALPQPPVAARLRPARESEVREDCTAKSGRTEAPCGHALSGRFLPEHWPGPSGSGPFQARQATGGSWPAPFRWRGVVLGFAIGAPIATAAWGALIWLTIAFSCVAAVLAISLTLAVWLVVFYLVGQMGGA